MKYSKVSYLILNSMCQMHSIPSKRTIGDDREASRNHKHCSNILKNEKHVIK